MKLHSMLKVVNDTVVWIGGSGKADLDLWFLPGFGESHLCFRDAFGQEISSKARILLFDLPGFGASPARDKGLTVEDCADLWRMLIISLSGSRNVVLVAHSMAGIIATQTANLLDQAPLLVVSIEGNLTKADAFFTGQAADYKSPQEFYRAFSENVLELLKTGEVPMSYYSSLQFADPMTLWTLGRSVLKYEEPGEDFLNLGCPTIYYWDTESTSSDTKAFLLKSKLHQRKLNGLGHWPMIKSPDIFYSALKDDVLFMV